MLRKELPETGSSTCFLISRASFYGSIFYPSSLLSYSRKDIQEGFFFSFAHFPFPCIPTFTDCRFWWACLPRRLSTSGRCRYSAMDPGTGPSFSSATLQCISRAEDTVCLLVRILSAKKCGPLDHMYGAIKQAPAVWTSYQVHGTSQLM